jgi:hypothetical protein
MSHFEKIFIGKGSKVNNLDIVRISISKEKLQEMLNSELLSFNGNEYLVFEVAALKETDSYGKSHTAYVSKVESSPMGYCPLPKAKKQK